MTSPTHKDLQRWAEMAERATPGPWTVRAVNSSEVRITQDPVPSGVNPFVARVSSRRGIDANAAFIAESRTAVPALLAEVTRLRALCREAVTLARDYVEHTLPIPRREADERLQAITAALGDNE